MNMNNNFLDVRTTFIERIPDLDTFKLKRFESFEKMQLRLILTHAYFDIWFQAGFE